MNRYFNTEGLCDPEIHYMVRLDERLRTIRQRFIDRGSYFVINRGRQYGKTTTLRALAEYLRDGGKNSWRLIWKHIIWTRAI